MKVKAKVLMKKHIETWNAVLDQVDNLSSIRDVNDIKKRISGVPDPYSGCMGCLSRVIDYKDCSCCFLDLGCCSSANAWGDLVYVLDDQGIRCDKLDLLEAIIAIRDCGYREGFGPETKINIPDGVL